MPETREERQERRRAERDEWCAARSPSDHTATFYPGDELRCPGTIVHPSGARVPCGKSLEQWVRPETKVIVRVRSARNNSPGTWRIAAPPGAIAGTDAVCSNDKCRSALEIFPILEATG